MACEFGVIVLPLMARPTKFWPYEGRRHGESPPFWLTAVAAHGRHVCYQVLGGRP